MKTQRKNLVISLFLILGCLLFSPVCFSQSDLSAGLVCEKAGKNLKIKTFINSESNVEISSFKFLLKYDSLKFKYNKFTAPKGVYKKYFDVKPENDLIYVEYTCKKAKILLGQNLNICNFVFEAAGDSCEGSFEILNFEITECSGNKFSLANINNLTLGENRPYLVSLVPSSGKLVPDFNKSTFEYDVCVDHDVSCISFDACCEKESESVSISRKKLAAAGKNTAVKITVKDELGKAKSVYTVNVRRLEKPISSQSDSKSSASQKSGKDCVNSQVKTKSEPKPKCKSSSKSGRKKGLTSKNGEKESEDQDDFENSDDSESIEDLSSGGQYEDNENKNNFNLNLAVGAFAALALVGVGIYKFFAKKRGKEADAQAKDSEI